MQFTITQTCETILDIEIVKKDDKFFAKVKRDYLDMNEYECWLDDGELMTEPVNSDEEYDAIIETFCSYIKENSIRYARICDKCGNGMNEGYVVEGGQEYYCTPKCLHEVYTPMEWQNRFSDECTENYWTEWDNIGSEYFLFNNQLINI